MEPGKHHDVHTRLDSRSTDFYITKYIYTVYLRLTVKSLLDRGQVLQLRQINARLSQQTRPIVVGFRKPTVASTYEPTAILRNAQYQE